MTIDPTLPDRVAAQITAFDERMARANAHFAGQLLIYQDHDGDWHAEPLPRHQVAARRAFVVAVDPNPVVENSLLVDSDAVVLDGYLVVAEQAGLVQLRGE